MNIDRFLKEKGITKAELAERMGILPQNVNANLKNPTEETIKNIARALGVTIAELFDQPKSDQVTFICPNCHTEFELKQK